MTLVPVAVAIFLRESGPGRHETWIQERTYGPLMGQWEFPGGKVEHGETPWDALVREIQEEISVRITGTVKVLGIFPHDYGDKRVLLHVFCLPWEPELATAVGRSVPLSAELDVLQWGVPLLPANISLVEHLCHALYDDPHEGSPF